MNKLYKIIQLGLNAFKQCTDLTQSLYVAATITLSGVVLLLFVTLNFNSLNFTGIRMWFVGIFVITYMFHKLYYFVEDKHFSMYKKDKK